MLAGTQRRRLTEWVLSVPNVRGPSTGRLSGAYTTCTRTGAGVRSAEFSLMFVADFCNAWRHIEVRRVRACAGRRQHRPHLTMSCSRTVALECALPAAVYWRLKSDPGWDAYCDALDGNARTVLSSKEDNGFMTVHASVRAKENPIPKALRRTLGVGPTFSFEITETWHRDRHDASHSATFETKPAVLPSKIRVGGKSIGWFQTGRTSACCILGSMPDPGLVVMMILHFLVHRLGPALLV